MKASKAAPGVAASNGEVMGHPSPVVDISIYADGDGQRVGTAHGTVDPFSDAASDGSTHRVHLHAPTINSVGW
jgi:hypothetical protein